MQATTTMKQFVFNRAGSMAVALSIVIGGTIGLAAIAIGGDFTNERVIESARVMPVAHVYAGQGEGLIDAANTRIAAVAPLQVFTSVGQGEGLIDGANLRVADVAPVKSFVWDGKFAGLTDGSTLPAIKAYPGIGQGEGLVDPANRTSEPDVLRAYPSPGQGEGLVGPGGLTE